MGKRGGNGGGVVKPFFFIAAAYARPPFRPSVSPPTPPTPLLTEQYSNIESNTGQSASPTGPRLKRRIWTSQSS